MSLSLENIQDRLGSLPGTYKRPGAIYDWLEKSFSGGIGRYTESCDGLLSQLDFSQAKGRWLDVWGQLFAVVRQKSEQDDAYRTRIQQTLVSWKGTPAAIESFLSLTYGISVDVQEDLVNGGWNISLPGNVPTLQYPSIIDSLKYVRPAGVPFNFNVTTNGLYVGATGYSGIYDNYMATGSVVSGKGLNVSTNNTLTTLPTTFLTDPTIKGAS